MKTSREYLGNQNVALHIESTTSKDTNQRKHTAPNRKEARILPLEDFLLY
jgi:hypothetical protein